jgi:hypothetical protein
MTTSTTPRSQPYPALVSRFRYASHGDTPAGVHPMIAAWIWAAYDDSPKPSHQGSLRDAARLIADAVPATFAAAPTFHDDGRLVRPRTRTDEFVEGCEEMRRPARRVA